MLRALTSPILNYELERAAAAKRWFVMRFGYISVFLGVVLVGLMIASASVTPSTPAGAVLPKLGRTLFDILTIAMAAAVIVATPGYASGLIAIEKDRKTLGLLLVTDLTDREIIQHKVLSQSIILASTFLAPAPIMFVCLVFGGVDWREVVGRFCLIWATFFFCCGVGILASAVSPDSRTSNRLARLLTWAALLIPPAAILAAIVVGRSAGAGSDLATHAKQFSSRVQALGPYVNPFMAAHVLQKSLAQNVPSSVPGRHGWMWCSLLALACFWLGMRGAGLAMGDRAAVLDTTSRRWAVFPGRSASRRARPTRTVWDNPVLWREAYAAGERRWFFWLLLGMTVFFTVMTFAAVRASDAWYHWIAIVIETFILFARVIDRGASSFAGEREQGTLDLVLLTELSPVQIFWGKIAGVVRGTLFFWALPILHALAAALLGVFSMMVLFWTLLNTVVFGAFFLVVTLTISAKSETRRTAGRRTLLMLAGILISPITAVFFGPLALVLSPTVWVCGALWWSGDPGTGNSIVLMMIGHAASLVLYTLITMGAARSLWDEIDQGLTPGGWAPPEAEPAPSPTLGGVS